MKQIRCLVFCVWALLPFLIGCDGGGKDGQVSATGTVTLDGQPLEKGTISFMPTGQTGTTGGGDIVKGKYSAYVSPGEMRVSIRAEREVPVANPTQEQIERGMTVDRESIIPAKYNDRSELKATVTDSAREFNYDLTSK